MSKKENIIFVGLMGAGKTTIGRQLAKHLEKTFFDSDHEIEKRTGVKIPVIFDLEGEDGFRKRESTIIKELLEMKNIVLATGGGAVLFEENRKIINENGYVIYLRAGINDLWKRMRHDKNRPLLQNVDVKAKLEEFYTIRNPLYTELADLVVDTGRQPASALVNQIKKSIQNDKKNT